VHFVGYIFQSNRYSEGATQLSQAVCILHGDKMRWETKHGIMASFKGRLKSLALLNLISEGYRIRDIGSDF
jgi:hypothetical protein